MRGKVTCPKTYTFRAQDVYVSRSKRIRFERKGYTFGSFALKVTLFQQTVRTRKKVLFLHKLKLYRQA